MALAVRPRGLAPQTVRISVACGLLSLVSCLHPPSAGAQTCRGNLTQGCTNVGAACKGPGGREGTCSNVPGLPSGERECACSVPPLPQPPAQPSAAWCQANNICPINSALANHVFYVQDLGSRCIDTGPPSSWAAGTPVLIGACNHTAGQQIRVKEIDASHDVALSVSPPITNAPPTARLAVTGATNAGFCMGVREGTVAQGAPLELQTCSASSPAQRFAVDGDALLMGSQLSGTVTREFVIERQNGSTVPQTPLVVATRNLADSAVLRTDARYFRFNAVDGSAATPTSGFLTVADETHLMCAAQCGWGTVVQIDDRQPLLLNQLSSIINVAEGTTIRGYRGKTYDGPEIHSCLDPTSIDWPVFQVTGRAVRFTGFRLNGPNGDTRCGRVVNNNSANQNAIEVDRIPYWSLPLPSAWIDHMEISHWPAAGSSVGAPDFPGDPNAQPSPCTTCGYPDTPIALVVDNFMHDDLYEVSPGGGEFAQIRANVFFGAVNQPVASRNMSCLGGYAAMDNLLLSETSSGASDDIDMHGSVPPHHWSSGLAGDYFDVGSNTFLKVADSFLWWHPGAFQNNVNQRGYSCRFTKIHDNVFLQAKDMAIRAPFNPPVENANTFNSHDPTLGPLLVGDFDADKTDDVFLATGAAWYYSSGGETEWRYLNRAPEPATALLLGDFDGDGRTDVLTLHGSNIDISWAGVSAWQTVNVTAWPLADLAVGDFDGDGRSDLLLATGTQWFFASGGRNWLLFADNPDHISDLRFGHFTDKTKKTQILRVHNHRWEVTEWGSPTWVDIGAAPVDSMTGLVAGDFNGDGFTDLAPFPLLSPPQPTPIVQYKWQYTSPGHGSSWNYFGTYSGSVAAIGRFDGGTVTGLIFWKGNSFYYTRGGGQDTLQALSRQVMR